jgi:predicted porin
MLGVNYGQSRQEQSDFDKTDTTISQIKKQEAAVATVTYNLNKFTQFIAEYSYAQNTWQDDATQHSNQVSLGTMFYW